MLPTIHFTQYTVSMLLHTKMKNQITINTKLFFYLSHILDVEHITLYTIDTFFPNAIHLVYTLISHLVNVLPTPEIWTIFGAVLNITVTWFMLDNNISTTNK